MTNILCQGLCEKKTEKDSALRKFPLCPEKPDSAQTYKQLNYYQVLLMF